MNKSIYNNYEHQMAYHCAPTIKGIKCGSMVAFTVDSDNSFRNFLESHAKCFQCHGLAYLQLSRQRNHTLMFFYRPQLLTRLLRRPLKALITLWKRELMRLLSLPCWSTLKTASLIVRVFPMKSVFFWDIRRQMYRPSLIIRDRISSTAVSGRCIPMKPPKSTFSSATMIV